MKKILILSACLIPKGEGENDTLFPGTVTSVDDALAGQLIAAGRAKYADEKAKEVDTTKQHMAEIEARAATAAVAVPGGGITPDVLAAALAKAFPGMATAPTTPEAAPPGDQVVNGGKGGGV